MFAVAVSTAQRMRDGHAPQLSQGWRTMILGSESVDKEGAGEDPMYVMTCNRLVRRVTLDSKHPFLRNDLDLFLS